jgi:hypothetical protein
MPYYSNFWCTGGVLGPAWANRADIADSVDQESRDYPTETMDISAWLHLSEAMREAVVADYLRAYRALESEVDEREPENQFSLT